MSNWSLALDMQTALWEKCRKYKTWKEMHAHAWPRGNNDWYSNELRSTHGPEMFQSAGRGEEQVEEMGFRLFKSVGLVSPYFFTKETSQLLHDAVPRYPLESRPPAPHMFLSLAGFWYFEEPVIYLEDAKLGLKRGLSAVVWMRAPEGMVYVFCLEADPPIPAYFGTWPSHRSIAEAIANIDHLFGKRYPEDEIEWLKRSATQQKQLLGAGIAFCYQHIFVDRMERGNRASRRRMEAVTKIDEAPDVHVVTLRRPTSSESSEDGGHDVNWKYRWWVRGHWRNQAVGTGHADRETIWIHSYMKGPEDRPVKSASGPVVFDVTR